MRVLCVAVLLGCGRDGGETGPDGPPGNANDAAVIDGGGADTPGGTMANPGTASQTLSVRVGITARSSARSGGEQTTRIHYDVDVTIDSDGSDVVDAIVELGPVGAPITMTNDGNGGYSGDSIGYPDFFELSVTRGSDFLTGAVIEAPRSFAITWTPDPPVVGQAATVDWSPTHAGTRSQVIVTKLSAPAAVTHNGIAQTDDTEALSASTFPEAGTYEIGVGRGLLSNLAGPGSLANIVLARIPLVQVP